jgi:ribosome-binding factor A
LSGSGIIIFKVMESTRQQKVARLLQRDLAEIMRLKSRIFGSGVMVSVTVVRMTPDLGLAKVYLSIFPSDNSEEVLKAVEKASRNIRYELGTLVGKQLRVVPELKFYLDDSFDYAKRIDDLLD